MIVSGGLQQSLGQCGRLKKQVGGKVRSGREEALIPLNARPLLRSSPVTETLEQAKLVVKQKPMLQLSWTNMCHSTRA